MAESWRIEYVTEEQDDGKITVEGHHIAGYTLGISSAATYYRYEFGLLDKIREQHMEHNGSGDPIPRSEREWVRWRLEVGWQPSLGDSRFDDLVRELGRVALAAVDADDENLGTWRVSRGSETLLGPPGLKPRHQRPPCE